MTHQGWSTSSNISYGGIARAGDQVFVTNMSTVGKPSSGVIAFDIAQGTSTEFAFGLQAIDLSISPDGLIWVLAVGGSNAHAFDPITFNSLGSVSMEAASGDVRSLAVDAAGDFYLATWDGFIAHLTSDGSLVNTLSLGSSLFDIDVSDTGLLAVGSRGAGAWLSTTTLSSAEQFGAEPGVLVSFVGLVPVPEPGSVLLLSLGLGLLATHRLLKR